MLTDRLPRLLTGRVCAWITLLLAALIAAGLIGSLRGAEVAAGHGTAPATAESSIVDQVVGELPDADVQPLVVVVTRPDGAALTEAEQRSLGELTATLPATDGQQAFGPIMSEDGQAAMLQVPVRVDVTDNDALRATVDSVRTAVADALPAGLEARTTGGAAFGADIAASFDGANVRLLLVTIGVVGLLLLLTYRSPILWLVPLTVVGLADQLAGIVTASLGERFDLNFDGGIISVLVFGAGANYALLLISRYREELRRHDDHRQALRAAWRASVPAILASNIAVVLALLTLILAAAPGTRGLGIASAAGLVVALLAIVLVLPAALAVVGRGAFWPFVPDHSTTDLRPASSASTSPSLRHDPWGAVATGVARHPWRVLVAGATLLAVMATGLIGTSVGLSQVDRFRGGSESADGLSILTEHFPAGSAAPLVVVTDTAELESVQDAVTAVDGVEMVRTGAAGPSTSRGDVTTLTVVGDAAPGTEAERELVADLREAVHAIPGADALVGGSPATDVDSRAAARSDLLLIAPVVLALVAVVLALLLRSLVAPVVLLVINVASTLAAIGAGAWIGRQWFGFGALDTDVPLLAFLFLVALGIDYTIFLAHRIRSEVPSHGTRAAVVTGVSTTGVVITSAGIVLAAVFAALGVLPLVTLGQLGLIVGLGVVVDTFVVRTLFVPAVISLLGERFWWPTRPDSRAGTRAGSGADDTSEGQPVEVSVREPALTS
ncbi:MAG: MMPL family transporter [Ornithinimicrobium sp.]|uniref:MMPL family transporter n=1 Tax=Ornithinimicrobium sp. TaxID=1977084 RepID=UPI0026DEB619|nr:MMPL family transporter [Ornithinimicrobium sp.]MDO5740002.1 MMPL family transporter [Ornithinimicrobium sp.]